MMAKCTYYLLLLLVLYITIRTSLQKKRDKSYKDCVPSASHIPRAKRGELGSRCPLVQGDNKCNMGLECCKEQRKGRAGLCADVDECLNGEPTCHSEAICTNTVGGYTCECREGFIGNGTSCKDDPCTPENPCGEGDCSPSDMGSGYTCQCSKPHPYDDECADLKGKLSLVLNGANRTIDNTNEYWSSQEDGSEGYNNGSLYKLQTINPAEGDDSMSSSIQPNGYFLRTRLMTGFGIYSPKICEPARWCFEFAYRGEDEDSDLSMRFFLHGNGIYSDDTQDLNQSTEFTVSERMMVQVRCGQTVNFSIIGGNIKPETTVAIDNVKIYAC